MELTPSKTKKYIRKALENEGLKNAVYKATQTAVNSSRKVVAENPYWEELR